MIHNHVTCVVNSSTAPLVTQGCMFLLRVLRGSSAPPPISPLTTRAGRKRRREVAADSELVGSGGSSVKTEKDDDHGVLNAELVNGWLGDALHDFITRK